MNARKIITTLLLLFVAVSVVVFIGREMNRGGSAEDLTAREADSVVQAEVVAYYFHGTRRCQTCLTIEAYTREALESGFATDIEAGRLAFEIINVDEPANEHFVEDFQLDARSVVLARIDYGHDGHDGQDGSNRSSRSNRQDERQVQFEDWKQLHRVWELVGEKDAFVDYVRTETQAMLAGS